MSSYKPAILFLIFNRPDTTQLVFESIRDIKPSRLYVAADGPRPNKANEKELCDQTRKIIEQVNWPCEVKTLFRDNNLGCKQAVSSAINWFFEQEEEGVILEDDCLPNHGFFTFCESLLEKYRHDSRIMHISGNNFQFGQKRGEASYYFSHFPHIWGWATWRRAWKHYDRDIQNLESFSKENVIDTIFKNPRSGKYWLDIFYKTKNNLFDTWDYQWVYSMWAQNGLAILPNVNLVSNIGFGMGTHTLEKKHVLANIPAENIPNITHPAFVYANNKADNYTMNTVFNPPVLKLLKHKISKWMR